MIDRDNNLSTGRCRKKEILYQIIAIGVAAGLICNVSGCSHTKEAANVPKSETAVSENIGAAAQQPATNAQEDTGVLSGSELSETNSSDNSYGIYTEGYSQAQLFENDYLLYFADCGSLGYETGVSGNKGLFQSAFEQKLSKDPVTGKTWGFIEREDIKSETVGSGTGETLMRFTVNENAEYDPSSTGIYYSFEVPNGEYEVTCGFFNPFSTRKVDILAEGECLVSQEKIYKYELTEYSLTQKVTDGNLDVTVCNLSRGKDRMQNPMLSYIKVRVVPKYDAEVLRLYLSDRLSRIEKELNGKSLEDIYVANTIEPWLTAKSEAEALLGLAPEADSEENITKYEQGVKSVMKAFNSLEKKVIYASFNPGKVWLDTEGTPIQAHGGHVQRLTVTDPETGITSEKWWWVGEDKTYGYRGGINAYSSDDLYNWKFEGTVMRNLSSREQLDTEEYFTTLYAGYTKEQLDNVYMCINDTTSVIERPKMIYNEKTGLYVMWFHADGPTPAHNTNYAAASAGVAVSESPYGPFRFIDRYRLNVCPPDQEDMHPSSKGMARDMNLFIDDDGTAYIIYSSEENLTLYISKLNDEYTYLSASPESAVYGEDFIRIFPGAQREAPALFKCDGTYYLMTSGCTGWAPNQARYAVSNSVLGTWINMGDPCINDTTHTTFSSQSTCIFCTDEENGMYLYMGDRWNSDELNDSRYIWLPINFDDEGRMSIAWTDEFTY